jgi:hypothetical protein
VHARCLAFGVSWRFGSVLILSRRAASRVVSCRARVSIAGVPIGPASMRLSGRRRRRWRQQPPTTRRLPAAQHVCLLSVILRTHLHAVPRPARGVFWTLGRVKQIVHRCALKRPVQHISRPPHLCPSRTRNPRCPTLDDVTRPGSPESLIALSLCSHRTSPTTCPPD